MDGATVFANDHGMAPGMGLNKNGKVYILLPGPPKRNEADVCKLCGAFYVTLQQEKTFILACFAFSNWGISIRGESSRFN